MNILLSVSPVLIIACTILLLAIVYLIGISWQRIANKQRVEIENKWNEALAKTMGFEIISNADESSIPYLDPEEFEGSTFMASWLQSPKVGLIRNHDVYAKKNLLEAWVFISDFRTLTKIRKSLSRYLGGIIFGPIYRRLLANIQQTIVVFANKGWLIPEFRLEPRPFMKFRFLDRFSSTKVMIEDQPTFNQRFILNAHDKESVSNIFDNKAISRILASKGLVIEGKGPYILIYRPRKGVQPDRLKEIAEEAIEIFESLGDLTPIAIYGMEEPGK